MKGLAPLLALVSLCALLLTACSGPVEPINGGHALAESLKTPVPAPTPRPPLTTTAVQVPVTPVELTATPDAPPLAMPALTAAPSTPAATPVATRLPVTPPATPASPAATPGPAPAGQTKAVPILMYHYVRPDPGPSDPAGQDLSVTPEDFAAEMQYLDDQHYTPITLGELDDVRNKRLALPAKPVVLTFDDGYRDFYTNAWPVLRRHGFKATIFIITGVVDTERYLTWDMIGELDRSGAIEVGSHTVNHPELPSLSDAQERNELFNSKAALESRLGHPVRSFCYPAGHYTQRDVSVARQAGYTIAVTTQGAFSRAGDPSLELPRVRMHGPRALPALKATL